MFSKIAIVALFAVAAQANVPEHSSFSYGVADPHTGDFKNQHETRINGHVVGQYSLLESDGTKRVVDYAANPHTGFNAIVRKDGVAVHPTSVGYNGAYGLGGHVPAYGGHGAVSYSNLYSNINSSPLGYANGYSNPLAYGVYGNRYGGIGGYGAYGNGHRAYAGGYGGYAGGYGAYGPSLGGYGGYGAYGPSLGGYGGLGLGYGSHGLGW